jgi:hypothetical protein
VAWKNHPLIQKNTFWEVQNGQSAQFWIDAWQQHPPLQTLENIRPYQNFLPELRHLKVAELWLHALHQPPWHSWKLLSQDLNLPENFEMQPWQETMGNRKIQISE